MTAPVRIDASAWGDLRFATLARLCGFADAEHALIKCAKIWSWQTEHYTEDSPTYVVDPDLVESALGPGGALHLVRARLAEEGPSGLRIRGSTGRIEWLFKKRNASRSGGEATKRKHADERGPAGLPLAPVQAGPAPRPQTGPNPGPLSLPPDQISDTRPPRAIVQPVTWAQRKAWWDAMLAAHDRLRRPSGLRGAIKPNTPDLAKHPNEQMLAACERFLREGGYDADAIDAKMRHVVLVHEAEAERLGHLDFFKPALIWDVSQPDRFPRKVDTPLEEAKRAGPKSRAGPRRAGELIGAAPPRSDHPDNPNLIPISEL